MNDEIEYDEEAAPLFSFWQALLLLPLAWGILIGLYWAIGSFMFSMATGYKPPLWMQDFTFLKRVVLHIATITMIVALLFWLKIRLQNKNNPEHLSSYLGFHEPNWWFFGKWTLIVVAIHAITWSGNITPTKDRVLENVLQYGLWLPLIGTLIIAPVWEEIFFRGILWTAIHDSVEHESEKIAFWISSLAFAFAHVPSQGVSPSIILHHLAFSWLVVRARTQGGSLALAIWLHFLSNFLVMAEALWAVSQRVQAA